MPIKKGDRLRNTQTGGKGTALSNAQSGNVIEHGRGYIKLDKFWVKRKIEYEKFWRFIEKHGYYLRDNDKERKHEVYNFRREDVRERFPEIHSHI